MKTDNPLRPMDIELLDGESNLITLDLCYEIRGNSIDSTINKIKSIHGSNVKFIPLSGKSAGGGVFQVSAASDDTIVGLNISAALIPKIRRESEVDIKNISFDEIVINESNFCIYAGAAITLQQLNQALTDELGDQFKVLGADLTSYTYAQVGSTFMTGGMGPQRRYFSDSVVEIALYDGEKIHLISGKQLHNYAGTYGWTGIVCAVKCKYHQLPVQEFAFSIPVKNTPKNIARLLAHFSRFVYLEHAETVKVESQSKTESLILGLEHITVESMQPYLNSRMNNLCTKIAMEIAENCESANADGMIFVYGLSELAIDEIISELVDDVSSTNLTIADIDLDYTYYFSDINHMRDLREAVSYAARNQSPKGSYSYKGHTDANIWVDPTKLESSIKIIWQAYLDYVNSVQTYFNSQPLLNGEILIYGHLNPVGFDPHNRITFATEDESLFHHAIDELDEFRNILIRELATICDNTGAVFTGGEKGAGSDHELLLAFDELDAVPRLLYEKFSKQKAVIKNAAHCFNWRALPPYR